MSLPLLAILFVATVGGAVIMGPIGIVGGGGAAVLAWLNCGQLLDDLEKERERRERGEPRFKPGDVAFYAVVVVATILAALVLNRVYEAAGP